MLVEYLTIMHGFGTTYSAVWDLAQCLQLSCAEDAKSQNAGGDGELHVRD